MYKRVMFLSLLVAAATGFPASGVNDFGATRSLEDNDSADKSQVPLAEHKSLITLETDSGNPSELIEESEAAEKSRKSRHCVFVIADDCSENGINSEVVLRHLERIQRSLNAHIEKTVGTFMKIIGVAVSSISDE